MNQNKVKKLKNEDACLKAHKKGLAADCYVWSTNEKNIIAKVKLIFNNNPLDIEFTDKNIKKIKKDLEKEGWQITKITGN